MLNNAQITPETLYGDAMKRWLKSAISPDIVFRSVRVALVVGTVLVAINYTDRLICGQCIRTDYLKMAVTYIVPYCVSTYASVSTFLKKR